MPRRYSPIAGLLALGALLLTASPGVSAEWDRFPPLEPREHVALKKRFDGPKYDDLRTCYRRFDSRVGADYFAAMVDVTAESGSRSRQESDARPFAKALYADWKEAGDLDGEDDVLVVLGLRNRSIAIHPGTKWKKLGFDGEVIDNTIEASHFEKHRRRRNYVDALCSLATAVDLRLASLEQEMDRRIAVLEQRLPDLDDKLTALHKKVDARFGDLPNPDHPHGKKLLARLAAARTKLDDAKSLIEDEPKEAVHLADQVEAVLEPVRADLETFNEDMARLDEAEEELAALKTSIEKRPDLDWEQPQAALLQLAKCEQRADEIRQNYEGKPWQVRDCRRAAEVHLGKADVHYFYRRTVLPAIAAVLLVLLLIGFVALRTLRRRRALRHLEPDLAEWRRRLDDASQRLVELELECPSYFARGRTAWQGDSEAIDRRVADATERMSRLLAEGRTTLARAEALRQKSHLLDASRLERALDELRDGNAASLLGDLDDAHRQAIAHLNEVVEVSAELAEQSRRAADAVTRASRAVEQRRELSLPTDHLSETLESASNAWKTATRSSTDDPKRAAVALEQASMALEDVAQRAESGNRAVQRVQGPLRELGETLDQKIRQLKFARIDLDKLRFDPQQELDAAKRDAVRVVDMVTRACEDEAMEAVERLQSDLDRLAHRLKVVGDAGESAPERAKELTERGKEVKERLMKMSYTLKSLPANEAHREESKTVGRYQARINRLPKQLNQAQQAHRAKHYLESSEQLDAIADLLDEAEALLDDLGDLGQKVDDARDESRALVTECEPKVQDLQSRAKQPGVCRTLRTLVSEQFVSLTMIADQVAVEPADGEARGEQANWLERRLELRAIRKLIDFLSTEINAELQAYEQSRTLAAQLQEKLASLDASSSSAQVVTHAREMLAGWSTQIEEGSGGGLALLRTGREVAKAVGRAAKISGDDLPLALSAASQHAYALSRYDHVHASPYGYGISGDCSHVADDLDQASAAVESGNHADALALLEAAIEQIELEDARADAAVQREFRTSQAQTMTYESPSGDLDGPGMIGNRASWSNAVSTLGEA